MDPAHQEGAFKSRFFPLARFELNPGDLGIHAIVGPVDWKLAPSEAGLPWLCNSAGTRRAQISIDTLPLEKDAAGQVEGLVAHLRESFAAEGLLRPFHADRGAETLLRAVTGRETDDEVTIRRFRLWQRDGQLLVGQLSFGVAPDLLDHPATADLLDLFIAQLMQADPLLDGPLADQRPPNASDGAFDCRALEVFRPHGFMELRLPGHWIEDEDEGSLCYFDPAEEGATLFANYVLIARSAGGPGAGSREVDFSRSDETEDGTELSRFKWMVSDTTPSRALIAIFDLVVLRSLVDDPALKILVEVLSDEIGRMRIGDPPPDREPFTSSFREPAA